MGGALEIMCCYLRILLLCIFPRPRGISTVLSPPRVHIKKVNAGTQALETVFGPTTSVDIKTHVWEFLASLPPWRRIMMMIEMRRGLELW